MRRLAILLIPFLFACQESQRDLDTAVNTCEDLSLAQTIFSDAYVWGVFKEEGLAVTCNGRVGLIGYEKLLLAEGAMERSIPFPGWTLPGVMTAGAGQIIV